MPPSRAILLLLAIGTLVSSADTMLRQVDLAKLRDVATCDEEARPLLSADDKGEKYHCLITDLRLHPQCVIGKDLTLVTELEALCRHRLNESDGFMNDLLYTILQQDLRGLTDELQAFATSSPRVNDGKGSNTSSSSFPPAPRSPKSPGTGSMNCVTEGPFSTPRQ